MHLPQRWKRCATQNQMQHRVFPSRSLPVPRELLLLRQAQIGLLVDYDVPAFAVEQVENSQALMNAG
jgi:hypothetical protein